MLGSKIKDFMTRTPHTIGEDISLSKAMEMMRENKFRHLPVQSRAHVVGVLSDRDIKLALTVHPAAKDLKVGDIMTEEPYAVSSDTPMQEVLSKMAINKYGCAIVKDNAGKAIGIFTATDAVRLLSESFSEKSRSSSSCCATESDRKAGSL
jgi:acetoin utilization protein AcuB